MSAARSLAPLLLAAAIAGFGCGPAGKNSSSNFSGAKKDVASAIESLESAGRKSDEGKICDELLATTLVTRMRASGLSCTKAVSNAIDDADTFDISVQSVTVSANEATAVVKSKEKQTQDSFRLVKQGGRWKIASLG